MPEAHLEPSHFFGLSFQPCAHPLLLSPVLPCDLYANQPALQLAASARGFWHTTLGSWPLFPSFSASSGSCGSWPLLLLSSCDAQLWHFKGRATINGQPAHSDILPFLSISFAVLAFDATRQEWTLPTVNSPVIASNCT